MDQRRPRTEKKTPGLRCDNGRMRREQGRTGVRGAEGGGAGERKLSKSRCHVANEKARQGHEPGPEGVQEGVPRGTTGRTGGGVRNEGPARNGSPTGGS